MKKATWILSAVILFASCTGGNESIIGKPTVVDYLPSIMMIAGAIGMLIGIVKMFAAGLPKPFGLREIATGTKMWFFWSLIIFVFGAAVYFFS